MATIIPVTSIGDVYAARRAAKDLALTLGFDERASDEMAVAVSELASNILRHAQRGELTLAPMTEGERRGLRVVSHDCGPGIADVEQAITDGFSTAGSLGYGLGSVNRLMDQCDIRSRQGAKGGTTITCVRWLRPDASVAVPYPLEFGAATRACPAMTVNGDAFIIKRWQACALVGVIDGLGHGQDAHRAAQTARQYVETHFDQPLDAIMLGVGRTCRATRGVVMALVRFALGVDGMRFSIASVGNIEACLYRGSAREYFIVQRGILGGQAPTPRVTEHHWQPGDVLVLHSDGVTRRREWGNFPAPAQTSATVMAQHLLRTFAIISDDATVVVVKDSARAG